MQVLALLPCYGWIALGWIFAAWVGYAWFARRWGQRRASLIATTNRYRREWMLQATTRDPRVLDGIITQSLRAVRRSSPRPRSSSSADCWRCSATDKAAEFVREIPFAARTTTLMFKLKMLVLLGFL